MLVILDEVNSISGLEILGELLEVLFQVSWSLFELVQVESLYHFTVSNPNFNLTFPLVLLLLRVFRLLGFFGVLSGNLLQLAKDLLVDRWISLSKELGLKLRVVGVLFHFLL